MGVSGKGTSQKFYWHLQEVSIYIGDSEDYTKNTLCDGSPFLKLYDDESYVGRGGTFKYDPNIYNENRGGFEAWCNLHGKYTFLVTDYSKFLANGGDYSLIELSIA